MDFNIQLFVFRKIFKGIDAGELEIISTYPVGPYPNYLAAMLLPETYRLGVNLLIFS